MYDFDTVCATGKPYREVLPMHTYRALMRYAVLGIPTGDFLYGFLTCNLRMVFDYADDENRKRLSEIYMWLRNQMPSACWGSRENVEEWISNVELREKFNAQHADKISEWERIEQQEDTEIIVVQL